MMQRTRIRRPVKIGKCTPNLFQAFFVTSSQLAVSYRVYEFMTRTIYATSFPGLSCDDEGRDEKALVWAGHVTNRKMAVFDSYSSRSGEISLKKYTRLRNK